MLAAELMVVRCATNLEPVAAMIRSMAVLLVLNCWPGNVLGQHLCPANFLAGRSLLQDVESRPEQIGKLCTRLQTLQRLKKGPLIVPQGR